MKLRTKYLLFVIILHLVALVLSFFIFRKDQLIFIASEVLILISVYISWQLFNELIQPLNMLMQGVEAIKDKDFNVKFVETGKYEMDQLISIYNHMIDELRKERTKQEEQHFFLEKLINTSPTGIVVLDFEDHIQQANPKAVDLLGISEAEIKNKSIKEIEHPITQQIKQLQSGESKTITLPGAITYKIQKSHFVDRGFPRHFIMIEELTAEILAAEKKAYGKVIRMMAHEVNNTVGPVNSILQSALNNNELWNNDTDNILPNALQVAMDRNQNLNLFMRNFADVVRLPEPKKKVFDLHQLLGSISRLMELRVKEKQIRFEYFRGDAPFYISADEQQLEQVLINVIKNATEAIGSKGLITFKTDSKKRKLTITDTGSGISPDIADNLFSPFYSTKKDGQGIGLTLVREILLNHGFEFSLKTVAEKQTEFVIRF
jgi:two-component system nitrogen regulation sensor histidine kinase NtrY